MYSKGTASYRWVKQSYVKSQKQKWQVDLTLNVDYSLHGLLSTFRIWHCTLRYGTSFISAVIKCRVEWQVVIFLAFQVDLVSSPAMNLS